MQFIHFLGDLVIELDKEADDNKNKLSIFLPFLVKKLMMTFTSKISYCSFICYLMTKGVIQKEKIMKDILPIINEKQIRHINQDRNEISTYKTTLINAVEQKKN